MNLYNKNRNFTWTGLKKNDQQTEQSKTKFERLLYSKMKYAIQSRQVNYQNLRVLV